MSTTHPGRSGRSTKGIEDEFQRYFQGIAEAHYVVRKVFRLADEQAKRVGLEPLEHKLLIQIYGTSAGPLQVSEAAARLDVAPALASRLIKSLERKGLVVRGPSEGDRRITRVVATHAAREVLAEVDRNMRLHVDYFQAQLTDEERAGALRIFAFYIGVDVEERSAGDRRTSARRKT